MVTGGLRGTLPENLPPAERIKQVERRIKQATPKWELEGPDPRGLVRDEPSDE